MYIEQEQARTFRDRDKEFVILIRENYTIEAEIIREAREHILFMREQGII